MKSLDISNYITPHKETLNDIFEKQMIKVKFKTLIQRLSTKTIRISISHLGQKWALHKKFTMNFKEKNKDIFQIESN